MENGDLEQSFSRLKQEIYSRVLRSIFMDGCQFMCIDRRPKRTFERGLEIIWETFCTKDVPWTPDHNDNGSVLEILKIFWTFLESHLYPATIAPATRRTMRHRG